MVPGTLDVPQTVQKFRYVVVTVFHGSNVGADIVEIANVDVATCSAEASEKSYRQLKTQTIKNNSSVLTI